ncbi:MAG: hypothetical protein GXX91_04850 [Verrucomicrobiaceae bacterium]|nr:hypothetical protein [Verrucomicrobiaceae bacterium]
MRRPFLFLCSALLGISGYAAAEEVLDYKAEVLSIMKKNCWDCHSNENEVKGNVDLDPATLADQIGPYNIIRPGNPDESGFVERLKLDESHNDFMPRKGSRLSRREIAAIEEWIAAGAIIDAEQLSPEEKTRLAEARPGAKEMESGSGATSDAGDYRTWTNTAGRTIEARLISLGPATVKLQLRSGKTYDVPLQDLSPDSAAQAKALGDR